MFLSGPVSAFVLAFIARSHVPALVGSNYRGWEGLDVAPGPWACMIGYSAPECLVQRPRPVFRLIKEAVPQVPVQPPKSQHYMENYWGNFILLLH